MKKIYLENKKLIRIAGIAILLFVAAFIIFYDRYDLFRLPFDAGVWGTASDWMMVIVTIFTAWFLVGAFKEQKRSNDYLVLNRLKSIMPKFEIRQETRDPNIGPATPLTTLGDLVITLIKNDARHIKFSKYHTKIEYKIPDKPYMSEGETIEFKLVSRIFSKEMNDKIHIITLSFEDIEGSRYKQEAFIKGGEVYFEIPVVEN